MGRTADRVNTFCFLLISGCLNCPFGLAQDRDLLDYEIGMIFFRAPDGSGGGSRLRVAGQ